MYIHAHKFAGFYTYMYEQLRGGKTPTLSICFHKPPALEVQTQGISRSLLLLWKTAVVSTMSHFTTMSHFATMFHLTTIFSSYYHVSFSS